MKEINTPGRPYARRRKYSKKQLAKIHSFARKWRQIFFERSPEIWEDTFAAECLELGFKNDSGISLREAFPDIAIENPAGIRIIINSIENIAFLGTAVFSYRNWKIHLNQREIFSEETREWMLLILERMIVLSDSGTPGAGTENFRFNEKENVISDDIRNCENLLEDVLSLSERGEYASPLHIHQTVLLITEPDDGFEQNVIRVETIFPRGQKIGYIPQKITPKLLEASTEKSYYAGYITELDEKSSKIIIRIAPRETLPIDNVSSITFREFSDILKWETKINISFRQKKFVRREKSCSCTTVTELQFTDKFWKTFSYPELQSCNLLKWSDDMKANPGTGINTWELIIRCKGGKTIKTCGGYPFPIEWERLQEFIRECLNLDHLKGNGRFYIEDQIR